MIVVLYALTLAGGLVGVWVIGTLLSYGLRQLERGLVRLHILPDPRRGRR